MQSAESPGLQCRVQSLQVSSAECRVSRSPVQNAESPVQSAESPVQSTECMVQGPGCIVFRCGKNFLIAFLHYFLNDVLNIFQNVEY